MNQAAKDSAASFTPCAKETVFLTASITKTVVAMLAVQCAERKELDLDQDINKVLQPAVELSVVSASTCSGTQRGKAPSWQGEEKR